MPGCCRRARPDRKHRPGEGFDHKTRVLPHPARGAGRSVPASRQPGRRPGGAASPGSWSELPDSCGGPPRPWPPCGDSRLSAGRCTRTTGRGTPRHRRRQSRRGPCARAGAWPTWQTAPANCCAAHARARRLETAASRGPAHAPWRSVFPGTFPGTSGRWSRDCAARPAQPAGRYDIGRDHQLHGLDGRMAQKRRLAGQGLVQDRA